MKIGDRLPELKFKMKSHSEEQLKSLRFHRVPEAPELFYLKFPLIKGQSGKSLLIAKIIVSTIDGDVKCYLYGQTGELYPAFYNHNSNTDSYIFKVNKWYIEEMMKYGIKEIENEKKLEKK